ncbi:variable surface lipoprotein [Metamycoplasma hominis]|uniref:variable surface lipoprotein n=5 Tax=Metamycoplasma hominis TaxID=2098 RepID=UPI003CF6BC43
MKKSKKILLTIGIAFPLLASTPLVAAGCVETNKPEDNKPEDKKPGTTPEKKSEGETTIENIINKHKEIKDDELNKTKSLLNELNKEIEKREIEKREIEKREEQNLLEKRNNLIKETEAKWDDITKKIDEYSKDATISKFPEFTQITDYLKYKNVELKNLKATKNNTIKLLVAKYFNILEAKILVENIIKNHNEIKDDELNKTKSLLNELNKEIEKREEQNLLEKRNNLIKETEAKWDDITKKIDEYSKDATISKFPEFTQITDYLKYKNVELKNLKATKNNTIKLLVAKYFNILEAKILENKTFIDNIIKNHNEIKEDSFSKTKSLLNELNKEIEKREEQNLLEKRNNLIKEIEAKWDDITKKIEEYSNDAIISKFPEFIQITNYLEYKNVELKNLKATKNNTIKLLVAKYFNILEAKILEFKENIININKYKEIKDDELNKTKSLLNELNKEIEKRKALSEAKKQLDSALKHAKKLNIGSLDFNQKFNFNKEFVRISGRLEKIKDNDLNAIKEITFELNSLINLTTSQKSKTTSEIKNDVEGEVHMN